MAEIEVLTSEEAAALLRVSRKTLYRLAKNGELPGNKVGRSWRFHRADLIDFLRKDRNA
jgi:excisionase family DNA binding protein